MSKIYTDKELDDLEALYAEKWTWGNKARMLSATNCWSNESSKDNIHLKIANACMDTIDKLIGELGTEVKETKPYLDLNQDDIEALLHAGDNYWKGE